jgi:hypothetical protein
MRYGGYWNIVFDPLVQQRLDSVKQKPVGMASVEGSISNYCSAAACTLD